MIETRSAAVLFASLALFAAGCSDDDVLPDGGVDAGADFAVDAGDAAVDATPDTSPDTSVRLDPTTITKFKDPLVIPPVMPHESKTATVTEYEIAAKQFDQQVLPTGMPKTTVWGYGRAKDPLPGSGKASTYNFPAFTIDARSNEKVRVKWINGLVDAKGAYLPHLLPVDQTLHWANPAGPIDSRGTDPKPYTGPVPFVTHVHGAHVASTSDGYPEAWYLPNATNIPSGYKTKGTHYGSVTATDPGAAIFEYTNDQRAGLLWYHDHALGVTRLNVYAGMAGFWILRDAVEDALNLPGPAPKAGDAAGTSYYEIPLAIQDRSFNKDGSLFYPDNRAFFDGFKGPYVPKSKVPPIWNPEFFGETIVVNGKTWPYLNVEQRLYRLRLLNGCNSRFLILKFNKSGLEFNQIGNEGGLLPDAPVKLTQLVMAPAERADVIVDFSKLNEGDEVILLNVGPDEPYKGPNPSAVQTPANPGTTGQVMKFKVVKATTNGNAGVIPTALPAVTPLSTTLAPRDLTLNEEAYEPDDVPQSALLGTGAKGALTWSDAITETPKKGDTEIWRVINLTADAHPIHLHLVMFQVLDRIPFDVDKYHDAQKDFLIKGGTEPDVTTFYTGSPKAPDSWEKGWKDTVIANPGEVTRIIAKFDLAGLYVWHCHILEHEDNEMMRPFTVLP